MCTWVCVCTYVHVLCVYMRVDVCVYMCMYVCACTLCMCVCTSVKCYIQSTSGLKAVSGFTVGMNFSIKEYIHCAHKCEYFGVLPLYHIAC